jgi:hypothetical protein
MRAYLEKCDKEWFDDFVYMVRQPLLDRGFEIVPFDGTFLDDFINRTSFNEDDILVGSVEATKAFWNELGFKVPEYIGYPEFLNKFYGRKIGKSSIGEIKADDLPIFIKPLSGVKDFTGFVLEKFNTLQNIGIYYSQITSDTLVYTSEVIDIKSEYRCFVHRNELVGIKHYAGDFCIFPDVFDIKTMIYEYKETSNVSYTLDVGIDKYGRTILIEVNDFWAIGGYGLDGKTYARMLIDRFQEIKKLNK